MRVVFVLLSAGILLVGCGSDARVRQLEERLTVLDARVEASILRADRLDARIQELQRSPEVVRARRFELVDSRGRLRGLFEVREDSFSTTTQLHLVDETGKYGTTYLEASGGDVNAFVRFSQPTNTILVPIKLLPAVTFPYQGPPITEVPKEFRPRN